MNENKEKDILSAAEKTALINKFTTQASLAHIHKLSSVGLLVGAGLVSVFGDKPLHSEVYILLGTYISGGGHILDYYFGNREKEKNNGNTK